MSAVDAVSQSILCHPGGVAEGRCVEVRQDRCPRRAPGTSTREAMVAVYGAYTFRIGGCRRGSTHGRRVPGVEGRESPVRKAPRESRRRLRGSSINRRCCPGTDREENSVAYTMTYDASHKLGRGGGHVQRFMRHIAREADEAAGFSFKHANTNIDTSRTHMNMSFVNDRNGSYRSVRSGDGDPRSDELEGYLNARLATVRKSLRKDAVVMRGIVLQLDPAWFEDHCPDWRTDGLNDEAGRLTITTERSAPNGAMK